MWGKKYRFGQKRLAFSLIISTFVPVDMRKLTIIFCALWLIASCGGNGEQMRQQLEVLEQQNRSGEQMLNDSLAESLVDYFDHHGSPNERMRAKYILGRTYYCMGELPRALETYYEAADCADTTATDCDFAKLSRIHAQSAVIYYDQVQPNSQLKELKTAEYYARKGNDTLMAIECYSLQADVYKIMHLLDSVIYVTERSSKMFSEIGNNIRSYQVLYHEISSLIEQGDITKAKRCIDKYERHSGLVDSIGNIAKGLEIYYYIKGRYYLLVNRLDSAEFMFRKELQFGKDLNNQIAGCKGLQEVFRKRNNIDSIAKYANLGYIFNDSAYSLAEMQNIQKFHASYNYNHNKQIAEENKIKAQHTWNALLIVLIIMAVFAATGLYVFQRYKSKKETELKDYKNNQQALEKAQSELLELREEKINVSALINKRTQEIEELQEVLAQYQARQAVKNAASLEIRLDESDIRKHLVDLLKANPIREATLEDFRELKLLINEEIPSFYAVVNSHGALRPIEYEICILIRCHFNPSAICKLTGRSDSYIANIRKGLLHRIYGIEGSPKEFDERLLTIK